MHKYRFGPSEDFAAQISDPSFLLYNPKFAHANHGSKNLLRKPQIHMQSSNIRKQTHDRSRMLAACRAEVYSLLIVASLPPISELLCVHDRSWLHCCRWLSCFACAINRGPCSVDGRGLVARF